MSAKKQDIINQIITNGSAIGYEYTYLLSVIKRYLADNNITHLTPKKYKDLDTKNTGVVLIVSNQLPPGFSYIKRNNHQLQLVRNATLSVTNTDGVTYDQAKTTID